MMRTVALITILFLSSLSFSENTKPNFYDFKNTGKILEKIETLVLFENASFDYNLQNTNSYTIIESACFFNQPSNTLHYILTTSKRSTLHFQIPVLDLTSATIFNKDESSVFLELSCKGDKGILVKEHSKEGMINYNLYFTSFQIPLSISTKTKKLNALTQKLIMNVNEFNS